MLERLRTGVRGVMRMVTRTIDRLSGSRITPNQITVTGLLAHIPIAILIGGRHFELAAVLLIIFGLFDTLDGELARLQKRTSSFGMFLDSSTDRIKEIMLYCGIVAAVLKTDHTSVVVIAAVGALGASLCTSYLNAWGEAVLAQTVKNSTDHKVNKTFRSGFLGFDLRILLIILGLLFNRLEIVIYTILVLATITVFQRFNHIAERLKNV